MNTDPALPLIAAEDQNPIPVFDCQVILSKPDADGRLAGRCANLPEITASGTAERDVLRSIMEQFKAIVQKQTQAKQPIPWIDPPETPQKNESQRFIPVHL